MNTLKIIIGAYMAGAAISFLMAMCIMKIQKDKWEDFVDELIEEQQDFNDEINSQWKELTDQIIETSEDFSRKINSAYETSIKSMIAICTAAIKENE